MREWRGPGPRGRRRARRGRSSFLEDLDLVGGAVDLERLAVEVFADG